MELRGFEVLAPLGSGQFGDVLLVRRASGGELLAAKIVRGESAEAAAAARREAELLRALRHMNVVRCIEVVQSDAQLAIVMEYASGGDLDGYIRASKQQYDEPKSGSSSGRLLTEECTTIADVGLAKSRQCAFFYRLRWPWRICMSVESSTGISNRRLTLSVYTRPLINSNGTGDANSTQNILLDGDGVVKLSDFGVSKPLERTSDGANTVIGTPFYMAPEVLEGSIYDTKCDIWSLGCVLYEMAAMFPPFVGSAVGAVVYQILEKEPPQLPERFSQGFHSLVACLLTKNPSLRPDVRTVLQSDFVQGHMMRLVSATTFSQPQMIEQIDNTSRSYDSQYEIPDEDAAFHIADRVVPLSHFLDEDYFNSTGGNIKYGGDLARQIFFEDKAAAKKNQERADDERRTPTDVPFGNPVQLQMPVAKCTQQKLGFEPVYDQYAANARAALINKQKILEDLGRYEKSIEIGIEATSRGQSAQTPPFVVPLPAPSLKGKEQSKDEYEKMLEAERVRIRAETKALQERMRAMRVASKANH